MKIKARRLQQKKSKFPMTPEERDKAAVEAMSKALVEEHKRWDMPLISWKDGGIVEEWPWKES